mgnify:CR=1 FL=1
MKQDDLFEELRNHLGAVILKHQQLKDDYTVLQKENIALNKRLKEKNVEIEGFQNQQNLSNIATNTVGKEGDSAALKRQINEFIREIDRCITHLQQ